ncbi:hypothetical protein MLD38_007122 [Melastoma candidum]|uniref:Uncharacterized protein n=1 Tax=Melastoma candidum TaxID=119954 RepID=A0ACB9RUC3_9MYRT|nr:hypothetical protein MLD38_007122 [Melastoma candidum]
MGKYRKDSLLGFLILLIFDLATFNSSVAQLTFDFYAASCPSAEFIIRNTVQSASLNDPSIPGKLLRLVFHDCFVEGCDASILLKGNGTEGSDPANLSLGGFSVIDSVKRVLEIFCPGIVSCADIIAIAARDAVEMTGGPQVRIATGRRDGRFSAASNVRSNMADTTFSIDAMTKLFSSKGLSVNDLVTLSGAHTIGTAHCSTVRDRFKEDSRGRLTGIDPSLDKLYGEELMRECLAGGDLSSALVSNDPQTSLSFDNQYYKNLVVHKGLFQSDSALVEDERTKNMVEDFATSQERFFSSWVESFRKLTSIKVKTGDAGEVRRSCSSFNR